VSDALDETVLGGSYEAVRAANEGGEVHHIPAYGAYCKLNILSKNSGPAIWMETVDHRRTQSWGRSSFAIAYRSQQQTLIERGEFLVAQQMDLEDVRSKFGSMYDRGIEQVLGYAVELGDRILP
jgi:hypothetical protein